MGGWQSGNATVLKTDDHFNRWRGFKSCTFRQNGRSSNGKTLVSKTNEQSSILWRSANFYAHMPEWLRARLIIENTLVQFQLCAPISRVGKARGSSSLTVNQISSGAWIDTTPAHQFRIRRLCYRITYLGRLAFLTGLIA